MRQVAVEVPIAFVVGDELDVARLRDADEYGVGGFDSGRADTARFGTCDLELMSGDVHRVVVHPEIDDANSHALAELA